MTNLILQSKTRENVLLALPFEMIKSRIRNYANSTTLSFKVVPVMFFMLHMITC